MLDKKRSCILEYYESIDAYNNYLIKYFKNEDYTSEIKKLDKNILNALLSLISLNLVYKKEDIVEKVGGLDSDSKLYDFVLDDYLAIINACSGDKYKIGSYESDSASNVFTKIRHKLAHGDFYIKDDKVFLNVENKECEVNIVLLSKFTQSLTRCYLSCYKENEYEKCLILDKATSSNVEFNANNIETILRLLTIKSYKLTSYDNSVIPVEIKNTLERLINEIKYYGNDKANIKKIEEMLIKDFHEIGYCLTISNKKVKYADKFKKIASTIEKENKSDKEKKYSFAEIVDKVINLNYSKDLIWFGSYYNQKIIENIILLKEYDLKELYKKTGISDECVLDEIYISSLLAKFNVLYSYPLDDIYKENNAYKTENERINELNFGLLNLDLIKPSYMNYKFDLPNQLERQVDNSIKQIRNLNNKINDLTISYNKTSDLSARERIESLIEKAKKDLVDANCRYLDVNDRYELLLKDIRDNQKYFNNKNIIEGIRNALAHGNVKILNPFETINPDDIILNFKDYDEDILCMDLSLTIKQFNTLFSEENVNILTNFINKENTIIKIKK